MGTLVLPPQDCLSSQHYRQNSYFSSARSEIGRKCFQAVMVPSPPAAQDCARHSHSGGSPPGDGLLPIPLFGQARVLSKRLPSSKASSTSTCRTPPLQRTSPGSPSSRIKPKLSRSAPAILPTPLVGTPPLAEVLLKGRLPFKVVQGNGPGDNNDCVQGNVSKKLNNLRNGVPKKITVTSNHMLNGKINGNFNKSKATSPDGAGLQRQIKDGDAKIRRSLERSNSGKGARKKTEMADFPAVTILQRPKTEEAAVELFEKFFQKSAVDGMSEKSENLCEMVEESEPENQFAVEEISDCEASDVSSCKMLSTPSSKSITEMKKDVKEFALTDVGGIDTPSEVGALDGDVSHGSTAFVFETGCEELAPWERWAGPSYINSPPPSALPLPRFSKKNLKIVTLNNFHVEHLEDVVLDQISTPPSSISPLYTSLGRQRHLNINLDAIATATKDLKRILNLDLCRM